VLQVLTVNQVTLVWLVLLAKKVQPAQPVNQVDQALSVSKFFQVQSVFPALQVHLVHPEPTVTTV